MTTNAYSSLWFQLFMPLQTEEWTERDVAFLARQLPLPRYAHVLDLCCGYGRHALKLAQRGYQVTGLDRDEAAISEARKRATEAGQEIDYLVGDMRQIGELEGGFDAIINMWQSFSYFDEEANRDLLRQIHGKLTPGGRFIIDMYNREYFANHQSSQRQEINGVIIETTNYLQGNRWHSIHRYSDASGELGSDHFDWQMLSPAEFSALATSLDFGTELVCTWSDEQKAPSPEIARVQMVLEKREI